MYTRLHTQPLATLSRRLRDQKFRHCHGKLLKNQESTAAAIIQVGKTLHGFKCDQVQHVPEYNMTAYLFRHNKTKSEYLHLERDDHNNVFSIGFRTTPFDSMGTPHILEHTVLCGSEKYPVRDPFFKMLNRSLATFMNAMTGPDYTFYPFSSQNEIDYRNLQKVYLDAVFKPNLTRLDFLQEGWRLEHTKLEDRKSDLCFKGVVYNEMKGAFSETNSLFGQKFMNTILPQGTYGYVSGGDPLHIPNLTHDFLKEFHETHYHPSNARFFSYGNFPVDANLEFVNDVYLSKYNYLDPTPTIVKPQVRWDKPKTAEINCRIDQYGGAVKKQNQIAVGYVLSDITNIYDTFVLKALTELMILGPNSAFYKSLIEKNFSGGYTALTGYDDQIRDTLFVVGLRDIEENKFQKVTDIVDHTLQELHRKGFERDHIESILHGFELSTKHQTPKFGLNTLFSLTPLWNHNGDVMDTLKVSEYLNRLKGDLMNPSYVKNMIEKYFISNNHRLTMTMTPDAKFDEKFNDSERHNLKCKVQSLTRAEKERIYMEGVELSEAQKKEQSLDILPCLKIEEITLNKTAPDLKHSKCGTIPLQLCEVNTNGVTYFRGILDAECLSRKQLTYLPFFNFVMGKLDTKNYNYRDFDKHISKCTSGLAFDTHVTEHLGQKGQYEQGIHLSSHCLDENVSKMLNIWTEIFDKPDFSNTERVKMLLNNYFSSLTSGIIDSGHTYAMQAARALVSSVDECNENLGGIRHLMQMQDIMKNAKVEDIQTILDEIGTKVLKGSNLRAAFHFSKSNNKNVIKSIEDFCSYLCETDRDINRINWIDCEDFKKISRGIHISVNIPVNFCAKVIPTVPYIDPDYPKLRVLTKFLTSKYLHPIVREQNGAYGGGAAITMNGIFSFYSYRDPNSRVTLDVFDRCSEWLESNANLVDEQNLFESKLSILQQMDAPIPEYSKGVDLFSFGLSYDIWKTQRQRVMDVTKADLIEVGKKYLSPKAWYGKCVIGESASQKLEQSTETWEKIKGPQQQAEVH